MIVIVMISLAGLSFVMTMSSENKAVHLHGDELQIEQAVASGAELLKALAELSPDARERAGGVFDNPGLFRGALVVDDELRDHRGRFSIVAPRIEDDELVGIRFGAENESARLNLAVLPQWEEKQAGAALDALMNLPGMTEPIAEAILDWIDVDPTPRSSGAEADYYSGLGVPYGPRNGIPTSLEELLLIRDVSRELLFGADADFNFQVEDAELERASAGPGIGTAQRGLPWASLLTVYSAERNSSYEGNPRIDLNEQDLSKLNQQLSDALDADWARFIIAYRQFGPDEDETTGPGESAPGDLDLSRPARFKIESVLDLVGVAVRLAEPDAPASDRRSAPVLESPFAPDPLAMHDYLFKLADQTTVESEEVLRGRVNVNEAPRAVLLGVPGLDRSAVDQILTARGARFTQNDPSRRHAVWLLTEGIVDLETMRELEPQVTAGGDVFRAQVVGYFDDSGPCARADVVVDATTSPPKQVYWKDLRLFGRGYSLETLGAERPAD